MFANLIFIFLTSWSPFQHKNLFITRNNNSAKIICENKVNHMNDKLVYLHGNLDRFDYDFETFSYFEIKNMINNNKSLKKMNRDKLIFYKKIIKDIIEQEKEVYNILNKQIIELVEEDIFWVFDIDH